MKKKILMPLFLLPLAGCFNTVHDDIPSAQIVLKSPAREAQALRYLEAGVQLEIDGKPEEALKNYDYICHHFLETEIAPVAFHKSGLLFKRLGKLEQAFEKLKFISKNYVAYESYNAVIQEEFKVACALMERYQHKKSWKWLEFFKDSMPAIDCFKHIVEASPRSENASLALYYIAQLQFESGEKTKAVEALDRIIAEYPTSKWLPDAYLLEAKVYLSFVNDAQNDQGMTLKAIRCYEDFLLLFGNDTNLADKVAEAKQLLYEAEALYAKSRLVLGDFYLYRRSYPQGAILFYNEARTLAPTSDVAIQANRCIDLANSGNPAPMTWADRLFGRIIYKPAQ